MSALISRAQAWSFMRHGESAVKSNFPVLVRLGRLQEPAHVDSSILESNLVPTVV